MIVIRNDGKDIAETNYFDTPEAKRGLVFLSMNDGGIRLLLPDSMPEFLVGFLDTGSNATNVIAEMNTADHVVLTRGPSISYQKQDMLEILFEDYSISPFSIHMCAEQSCVLPRNQDIGYEMDFSVWTKDGKQFSKPCYYRTAKDIPYLKPFPVNKRKRPR